MEYHEFGRTGFKVSRVGMGTYYDKSYIFMSSLFRNQNLTGLNRSLLSESIGLFRKSKTATLKMWVGLLRHQGGRSEKIAALRRGLELGINLIDTAEVYATEDIVADAIEGYRRDDLFVATKVSGDHLRYGDVLKAAHSSLKRLGCSYIDLYMVHWPDPRVPIEETMKAMEKLVEDGKVRFIGVSQFSLEQMRRVEEVLSKNKLASNQVEYNLRNRGIEKDLLPYCEQKDIAVMSHRPIAAGALADPNKKLKTLMNEISRKHGGKTPAQIALNWLMTKSKVIFPIPRASRPERVIENVGSVGWSLDADDMRKLEACACLELQVT